MRYPTDEELNNFIGNLEAESLYAPPYLKDDILAKIDTLTLPTSIPEVRWWQSNTMYNIKVIIGIAAALVLIFTLPLDINLLGWQEQIYEQRIEAEIAKSESTEMASESELDRLFRIGTTAITETGSMIIDKLNIFDGLFEKP